MKDRLLSAFRRHSQKSQHLMERISVLEMELDQALGFEPGGVLLPLAEAHDTVPVLEGVVPSRIKELRQMRGLRQADLAARTGIARPNIARLESRGRLPSLATLIRIAAALGVTVDDLLKPAP